MKNYKMLRTTQGSRDGIRVDTFLKDGVYPLDESLAEQFYHQGVIEESDAEPAATGQGEAGVPLDTQRIEELVSVARDKYGLNVDSTMSEQDVRLMIEQAKAPAEAAPEANPHAHAKPAKKHK